MVRDWSVHLASSLRDARVRCRHARKAEDIAEEPSMYSLKEGTLSSVHLVLGLIRGSSTDIVRNYTVDSSIRQSAVLMIRTLKMVEVDMTSRIGLDAKILGEETVWS